MFPGESLTIIGTVMNTTSSIMGLVFVGEEEKHDDVTNSFEYA